ncbi:MAG TPA: diacylglycerol kinase family protein [Candidatus Saccharimonadales bacterium]
MTYTIIAVIYNPNSTGSSKTMAEAFVNDVRTRLPKQNIELIATEYAGHAGELAYEIAKKSDNSLIISSSGDGGYNEVVNGAIKAQIEGSRVTTGILPAGNANDHHRNLSDGNIVDMIADGKTKTIDLLRISGTSNGKMVERYAHSYIGVGFSPKIAKVLNKNKLNIFNEVWLVARMLVLVKPIRLKLGKKIKYYESIIFSNVDSMSKYLKISSPSPITDGKFEVTIFKRRDKLKFILTLLKASFGGVKEDKQVTEFTFETVDKTLVQMDGEVLTLDAGVSVTTTIEKQVLRCVV